MNISLWSLQLWRAQFHMERRKTALFEEIMVFYEARTLVHDFIARYGREKNKKTACVYLCVCVNFAFLAIRLIFGHACFETMVAFVFASSENIHISASPLIYVLMNTSALCVPEFHRFPSPFLNFAFC